MRKFIKMCLLILVALIAKPTIAQEAITVKPTPLCDGFEIKFKMPEYTIVDTNILEVYGIDRTYSLINVNHKDFHNFAYKAGTSTLSAFTIALPIPENIEDFSVESSINMKEFATNLSANDFITLPHALLPIQEEVIDNDDSAAIQFIVRQDSFPSSDGLVYFEPFVDEAFYIMGQSGVYLTFCPFVYNTNFQSLATIDSITITFTYTGNFGSKSYEGESFVVEGNADSPAYRNYSVSKIDESYVNDIFDYTPITASVTEHSTGAKGSSYTIQDVIDNNMLSGSLECIDDYVSYVDKADNITNAKLLIVSAPGFVDYIKPYVNYKRYQGYKVALVKTSNSISRETLSHFLRIYLQKTDAKPNYVLLVGGTNKDAEDYFIPFMGNTAGSTDRTYNPANDYEYAMCREDNSSFWNALKNTVIKWRGQYFHIGRFNVTTIEQLKNVIYHVTCSEQNYQLIKSRILKITGRGKHMCWSGGALRSIEFKGVEEYHLNQDDSKEHFEEQIHADTPWWLILYNGHGGDDKTSPYTWKCKTEIGEYCRLSIDSKPENGAWISHDVSYPIMFFQACSTGAYGSSNYFGAKSTYTCSSAYIGASTTTGAEWGRVLLNKAFDHGNRAAWETKEHIGEFLDLARERTFKQRGKELQISGWSNRWYALSRFNLFGDPSMIIKGYNIENLTFKTDESIQSRIYYKVLDKVDTNNKQIVVSGNESNLTIIAKNSISLKPGFKVEKLARFKASIDKTIAN